MFWRNKRITVTGWAAVGGLVTSLVGASLRLQEAGRPAAVNVGLFIAGLFAGLLVVASIFRSRQASVRWALAALGVIALAVSGWFFSGIAFFGLVAGALVAWFPHCWELVGMHRS